MEATTATEVYAPNQLVRIEQVSKVTTLAKSSINLWVSQGKFPKPIMLSPVVKVWRLSDINSWIEGHYHG
jgi:prophage regulatory protein